MAKKYIKKATNKSHDEPFLRGKIDFLGSSKVLGLGSFKNLSIAIQTSQFLYLQNEPIVLDNMHF